jgi:hypothetical protein
MMMNMRPPRIGQLDMCKKTGDSEEGILEEAKENLSGDKEAAGGDLKEEVDSKEADDLEVKEEDLRLDNFTIKKRMKKSLH